jgi:hypothetical protein
VNNKIFVITAPDDVEYDALCIAAVGLSPEQSEALSNVLKSIDIDRDINLYVYNVWDDIKWIIDKSAKADLIFANAGADDQQLIGFLAAKRQTHLFGESTLGQALNKEQVFSQQQIEQIIGKEVY